jgi:hypothetical protein
MNSSAKVTASDFRSAWACMLLPTNANWSALPSG